MKRYHLQRVKNLMMGSHNQDIPVVAAFTVCESLDSWILFPPHMCKQNVGNEGGNVTHKSFLLYEAVWIVVN